MPEVSLNGQPLSALGPEVRLTDLREDAPELRLLFSPNAKYAGTHLTGRSRRWLAVQLSAALLTRDPCRRAELADRLRAWADMGGSFRRSDRPHQRLRVICTGYPDLGGAWKWQEELSLTFTAYGVPFWEDETLTVSSLGTAGTSKDISIQPPGTAEKCFLRWDLTNSGSGTLTALKLASLDNGSFITLNGLSIAPGGRVVADYDLNGYLTIRDGNGNSLLNKRNADSYDDVTLTQRKGNTIRVTADSPVTGFLSARGLYL